MMLSNYFKWLNIYTHIWIGKAQLAKILAARVDHCTIFFKLPLENLIFLNKIVEENMLV